MGKMIELPSTIDIDEIVAKKGAGYKPDLRIYTAGIEPDRTDKKRVHMIGSSTQRDMQGDVMSLLALNDMTKAAPNMTIWLNHNYDLPDSIFGSVAGSPQISHQDGIADLHLNVDVETDNPAAARVKKYIDNGRKLGCSIGCMVTKYEVPTEDDGENWEQNPIIIHGVYVVEYSVVGIPCNQRSWVENAIRGVFTRTLDPALAPAMKALWPSRFHEAVKNSPEALRRSLLQATPDRPKQLHRVEWNALNKSFIFSTPDGRKEFQAEEMKALLRGKEENGAEYNIVEEAETLLESMNITDLSEEENDASELEEDMKEKNIPGIQASLPIPEKMDEPSIAEKAAGNLDGAFGEEATPEEEEKIAVLLDDLKDISPATEVTEEDAVEQALEENKDLLADPRMDDNSQPEQEESTVAAEDIEPEVVKEAPIPAATLAMLDAYNVVGKSLGLPTVTPDHFKTAQHPVLQTKAVDSADLHPDHLMKCMAIHSLLHEMTGGKCCALSNNQDGEAVQEAEDQAREASGQSPSGGMSVAYSLGEKADLLMKSVERYNASLADVVDLKKEATLARKEIDEARTEMLNLGAEIVKAQETLAAIKDMPLGNPVKHTRTVHEEDNVASRDDFLRLASGATPKQTEWTASDNLGAAFAATEIKAVEQADGSFIRYRFWPEGVGGSIAKGVRPALSPDHIAYMDFADIRAYREGKAAKVPCLGSQVVKSHVFDTKS